MGFTTIFDPDTCRLRSVDFKTWLSITWTEIVDHPDAEQRRRHRGAGTGVDYAEGIKLTDPRRMAEPTRDPPLRWIWPGEPSATDSQHA
jgi:hypothetical protein